MHLYLCDCVSTFYSCQDVAHLHTYRAKVIMKIWATLNLAVEMKMNPTELRVQGSSLMVIRETVNLNLLASRVQGNNDVGSAEGHLKTVMTMNKMKKGD